MEKPITWSFSALKSFRTCARKYHAESILKLYPHQETEATRYGTELHKAFELYLLNGTPVGPSFARFLPMLDRVKAIPGALLCEYEMGVKRDLSPCAFNDPDRWARGIADVVVVDQESGRAHIIDWKSGGAKYADKRQLELMALMLFSHFPKVNVVKGALAFVNHNALVKATYKREDAPTLWDWWYGDVARLEASHDANVWHPNPSGLCKKWCPVEHCEFRGE